MIMYPDLLKPLGIAYAVAGLRHELCIVKRPGVEVCKMLQLKRISVDVCAPADILEQSSFDLWACAYLWIQFILRCEGRTSAS